MEGEERREIIRILTDFSIIIRPQVPAILQSYEFLAEIDFIRAKAHFSIQTNATKPSLEDKQIFGLDHGHTPTITTLAGQA